MITYGSEAIVEAAYRAFLGRDPDPGAAGMISSLADGTITVEQFFIQIIGSDEFRTRWAAQTLPAIDVAVGIVDLFPIDAGGSRIDAALALLDGELDFDTTGKRWTREQLDTALGGGLRLLVAEIVPAHIVGLVLVEGRTVTQIAMRPGAVTAGVVEGVLAELTAGDLGLVAPVRRLVVEETARNGACRERLSAMGFVDVGGEWMLDRGARITSPAQLKLRVGKAPPR